MRVGESSSLSEEDPFNSSFILKMVERGTFLREIGYSSKFSLLVGR